MNKKCINAYKSIRFSNNGQAALCCKSSTMLKDASNQICSIETHTMMDALNSKGAIEIREALDQGIEHPNCKMCWDEEAAGLTSKRTLDYEMAIKKWGKEYADSENVEPGLLEINLGTLCNLKCRICGPWASSRWNKETIDNAAPEDRERVKQNIKEMSGDGKFEDDSKTWENLESVLPYVKEIDMYGGEPFMIEKQWQVLQKSVDLGYAKDQILHFNTNGTHYEDKNIEILKNFKHVEISLSIDGVGKSFEYQRYLAKWDEVQSNLKKFKLLETQNANIRIQICITLNILNVWHYHDYAKVFKEMGIHQYVNILHFGEHYSLYTLLENVKDLVKEKYNRILATDTTLNAEDIENTKRILDFMCGRISTTDTWNKFIETVKRNDAYRNQSFSEVYPEFSKIIGFDND
jgi:MoaA/NifB/PqqE/SkfB family radical SAM enzyme